jgi:uncharacterized protein with HEPN domain
MGVDIQRVWTIIESDLPALEQAVTTMLSALQ